MASQNEVVYTEIAKIDRQSIVNIIGVCNFVDNYRIERPTGVPNIHFDIFDKNGDGIRVYAFYELAKGILNRVQLNKTYAITSVSVQPKDPYFNYLHEFKELIVTSHTKIMEVREDGMVVLPPRKEYEIIALNEVPVGQNVGFAVMGKLTWVGSLRFIDTRWEENIAIVNVRLIDKYGGECNLSILGKSAHEVTVKDLGCVVVVSGVRARNYEGKLSLRSLPNVKITVMNNECGIHYTRIADIDCQNTVNIIGVCNFVEKYRITSDTGAPKIFFHIYDKNGDGIRIYAFHEMAKGILNQVQLHKTYSIACVAVQEKDCYVNYLHKNKELLITKNTKITEVRKAEFWVLPPQNEFEIVTLDKLPIDQPVGFAVLARITWVGELKYINTIIEDDVPLLKTWIVDVTGTSCKLSLLGISAYEITPKDLGNVVHVSGVKAKTHQGETLLCTLCNVKITVYRHLTRAKLIRKHYGRVKEKPAEKAVEEKVSLGTVSVAEPLNFTMSSAVTPVRAVPAAPRFDSLAKAPLRKELRRSMDATTKTSKKGTRKSLDFAADLSPASQKKIRSTKGPASSDVQKTSFVLKTPARTKMAPEDDEKLTWAPVRKAARRSSQDDKPPVYSLTMENSSGDF
ncbi:unnamed protein product [Caenorhabditis auriculariae]|uniref:Uncharacterized protein n=1 Tax=Caenorhabditis auriculariae TaxID=2777116 RepID=A0A8S1GTC7_9PELO|nr:unnamed protein product [Caenorhabditis auriculariae]